MEKFIFPCILAFSLSVFFTFIIKKISLKFGILDDPNKDKSRKIQTKAVPLLGGLAIFISFNLVVLIFISNLLGGYLLSKYLWGIFFGGLILMFGGYLDDKYNLKAKYQFIFPIVACLIIIACGIGITYISNPLGGIFYLNNFEFNLFTINNLPYKITIFADIFTLIWLMGMMYTTKILDGLDGLVSGITIIGSFIIFFLSLSQQVAQPETAILAIILAGSCLGFLIFNFHPAKIFLGESGSLFTGFMLGVLSIISGGKIATALLILGIPILDLAWVIIRRLIKDKKSPFSTADKKHLHFKLLDIGFSHRQAVLFLYLLTLVFGMSSLFLQGKQKLLAFAVLVIILALLSLFIYLRYHLTKTHK